ncbi:MAG: DNA polymerase III subunit alpha [Ruminococcaceae bacterium]|nr:DNA polymerase III subunit alpha [Oscillospiraceae bacterium]
MNFVHLHVHTEYSFLDGLCRLDDLLAHAKEQGMTSLAITDHGAMYGVVEFYKKAKEAGIHPIIGCEVYTAGVSMHSRTHENGNRTGHLVLLAENMTGYQNLVRLVSAGFTDGFYYKPRIDRDLLAQHTEGLIALSACLAGDIPQAIINNDEKTAQEIIESYINLFGKDNFFLELQDHGIAEQKKVNARLIALAEKYGVGLVATNDVHYIRQEDAKHQDVLMCIQTNRKVAEEDRMRFETDEFYLKSEAEMAALFENVPESLSNTEKIAQRCQVDFTFGKLLLPKYPVPSEADSLAYLTDLCQKGLSKRYGKNEEAQKRLDYELGVIHHMGYVDYFLIVWDFIKYAKDNGIPVGPGRGSAAGSIVAYCLGITNIDPLAYNLLFERFLNPERISMPDIDVDICNEGRQRVIDYVVEKYGRERVAQIITFNAMKARAAVRDVGRVLDVSYADTDAVAKMIPNELGMTLKKALELSPDMKKKYDEDPEIHELIEEALALEGLIRNAGTHAAGVVIAGDVITNHIPIQKNDDVITTQFPMGNIEELGFLKMDFLGLRNLSIIDEALSIIAASGKEKPDMSTIPINRPEVYDMLSRGETEGVFQLESGGMKQVIKELEPRSIEDIIAVISLYRPGPMDQIPRYIENKRHPEKVAYKHPILESILDVTYGCMVYQEQVMQIVREMAGYSLGRADLVRRAMSKKKAAVMAEERKNFIHGICDEAGHVLVDGAVRRGVPEEVANSIFDEMMDFAQYAFNKSHAAAYAAITYQTAYLKCFYPAEYMAALLSSVLDSPEKVARYSAECKRMGIRILPPDINKSRSGFTVTEGDIRFGLAVIKNVGAGVIDLVVAQREQQGPFQSYEDFVNRTAALNVTKRVHEFLIKAGAFDSLGETRAALLVDYEDMLVAAANDRKQNVEGQISLFGGEEEQGQKIKGTRSNRPEFPQKRLLALEKESVGFYLTGHPLDDFAADATTLSDYPLIHLAEAGEEGSNLYDGMDITLCGIVSQVREKITKSSQMMAFVSLEDATGSVECIVFPKIYSLLKPCLIEDNIIVARGRLSLREDEEPKLIMNEAQPMAEAKAQQEQKEKSVFAQQENKESRKLFLKFCLGKDYLLDRVKPILAAHSGKVPVCIHIEETKATALAPQTLWVEPNQELLDRLSALLGQANVVLK